VLLRIIFEALADGMNLEDFCRDWDMESADIGTSVCEENCVLQGASSADEQAAHIIERSLGFSCFKY
jgi:hypothetical protein